MDGETERWGQTDWVRQMEGETERWRQADWVRQMEVRQRWTGGW